MICSCFECFTLHTIDFPESVKLYTIFIVSSYHLVTDNNRDGETCRRPTSESESSFVCPNPMSLATYPVKVLHSRTFRTPSRPWIIYIRKAAFIRYCTLTHLNCKKISEITKSDSSAKLKPLIYAEFYLYSYGQ